MTSPVMKDEASLARKTTAGPNSDTSAYRRIGASSIHQRCRAGSSTGDMSVLTYPGASALTLTPNGAHSTARLRVRWCTAALEALYAVWFWGRLTMKPDMEPMFTIEPRP